MLHVNYCGLCKITLASHIKKMITIFSVCYPHKKVVYGNQTANPKAENGSTADIVHGNQSYDTNNSLSLVLTITSIVILGFAFTYF